MDPKLRGSRWLAEPCRPLPTNRACRPRLSIPQILGWADAYHHRTGEWPNQYSGEIPESPNPGENWSRINSAMRLGLRGMRGGFTLAQLLLERRGVGIVPPPRLTIPLILAWMDAFHGRTGHWPTEDSGSIPESYSPNENWSAVNGALRVGVRGLPGGSTLSRVLAEHRGVRRIVLRTRLTIEQILAWADDHFQRTGKWPTRESGPVPKTVDENWGALHAALLKGARGLPGGITLGRFLAKYRGRKIRAAPRRK